MCWIVRTRFCLGIWLHNPENEENPYMKKAEVIPVKDYKEAVGIISGEAGGILDMQRFKPNRLYQVREKKIYMVFYNRKVVGFTEMEKSNAYMVRNHMQWQFFKKKYRLNYQAAVAMVTALGAITGRDEIMLSRIPVSGRLYKRK